MKICFVIIFLFCSTANGQMEGWAECFLKPSSDDSGLIQLIPIYDIDKDVLDVLDKEIGLSSTECATRKIGEHTEYTVQYSGLRGIVIAKFKSGKIQIIRRYDIPL